MLVGVVVRRVDERARGWSRFGKMEGREGMEHLFTLAIPAPRMGSSHAARLQVPTLQVGRTSDPATVTWQVHSLPAGMLLAVPALSPLLHNSSTFSHLPRPQDVGRMLWFACYPPLPSLSSVTL